MNRESSNFILVHLVTKLVVHQINLKTFETYLLICLSPVIICLQDGLFGYFWICGFFKSFKSSFESVVFSSHDARCARTKCPYFRGQSSLLSQIGHQTMILLKYIAQFQIVMNWCCVSFVKSL